MPKFLTAGVVTLLLAGLACSQRVEPEEEYARRERDRPLLPPSAAPAALVDGPGSAGGVSDAMPRGPADIVGGRGGRTAGGAGISGTIQAPEMATAPSGAVVFVIVRPAGRTAGPPLAVQRLTASEFPVEFEIGPEDAMLGEAPFPDRVTVEARLDGDGDPLSRSPGDRSATSGPLSPGATGVTLSLAASG
ncbi:MAG: c-type cytochrome biogenesis protein CcmI/CycH [Gemmatimonadota bacterium]